MLLTLLAVMAVSLTVAMFATKNLMLGFPCVIFWAIAGAQAFITSTATWDVYYLTFFGCEGMAIFSSLAMYGLRRKDLEPMQEPQGYIDERPEPKIEEPKEPSFKIEKTTNKEGKTRRRVKFDSAE